MSSKKADREEQLDHFKFWQVDGGTFSEKMDLIGECDKKAWTTEIGPALYLGNPVDKIHGKIHVPIVNDKLHYLAYAIGEHAEQPPRRVTFSNQFTDDVNVTWDLGQPVFLLVPAGKVFEGKPKIPPGDHFVCYAVVGAEAVKTNVSLQDQFDFARQKREEIDVLIPRFYAVPVEKRRNERRPEVPKNKTQLAIYEFQFDDFRTTVHTADQLARHTLQVSLSQWLAVPSIGKCEELG